MTRETAGKLTGCNAKTIERIESGYDGGDIGISKIINLFDTLGYCLQVVKKQGIIDMESLQNGERY